MTTIVNSHSLPLGSEWLNTSKNTVYLIVGFVESCDSDSTLYTNVLYRSDDMPQSCYRHRPISDWFGVNRDGDPRFVPMQLYYDLPGSKRNLIEKFVQPNTDRLELIKKILIKMFQGKSFDTALIESTNYVNKNP